jgi:isopentenyl-diphosphate delta-isomerase
VSIQDRKKEHIDICLKNNVSFSIKNGFEKYRLLHKALPEMSISDIDLSTQILGKAISYPLYISPMTGGTHRAGAVNRALARLSDEYNIPICVGSQRAALEDENLTEAYKVKTRAPVFANIGAVQLNYGYGPRELQKAVDMINADALVLHINPLQEAIQPGGNTDFSNLIDKIGSICKALYVPVIAKEVGHGISGDIARKLELAGVSCIDVAGSGGTSWAAVEGYRANRRLGELFRDWGIPTADCLVQARKGTKAPIIASGGIRNGVEVVKALCLGATVCGIGAPLLRPSLGPYESLKDVVCQLIKEMRIAMFCIGAKCVADLNTEQIGLI